jgi:tetratricopeptide (TPR) repeat protein
MEELIKTIEALRATGRQKEALEILNHHLEKQTLPEGRIFMLIGTVLTDIGELERAIEYFQKSLDLLGKDAWCLNNLSVALKKAGNIEGAKKALETALEEDPDYVEALNNLGNILRQEGRLDEAIELYQRALSIQPEFQEIKVNLALAYSDKGDFPQAIRLFEEVISKAPALQPARRAYGALLAKIGKTAEAELQYRYAIMLNPNDFASYSDLAGLLLGLDMPVVGEAEELLKKALSINSREPSAYYNLSVLYLLLGKRQQAVSALKKAIELNPNNPQGLRQLASLKGVSEDSPEFKILKKLEASPLPVMDKFETLMAMAEFYKAEENDELYFQYLVRANRLKRQTLNYLAGEVESVVETRFKIFSEENLKKLRGFGFPTELPVFIVGMPRSGTTLMESILDSHPEVYGAGELKLFQKVLEAGILIEGTLFISEVEKMPERVFVAPTGFFEIGRRYAMELRSICPTAKRITDKMPGNFWNLGIIRLSLPWARVIVMRRHPLDNLLSCFEQPFSERHEWTYTLEELAHYYNCHIKLQRHWEKVFGNEVLFVDYEELVLNFRETVERVLGFLGISWHEDLERFYEKERIVKTASMEQVRKPLYRGSIGRWRKYEKFLAPLIANLSDEAKQEMQRIEEKVRQLAG